MNFTLITILLCIVFYRYVRTEVGAIALIPLFAFIFWSTLNSIMHLTKNLSVDRYVLAALLLFVWTLFTILFRSLVGIGEQSEFQVYFFSWKFLLLPVSFVFFFYWFERNQKFELFIDNFFRSVCIIGFILLVSEVISINFFGQNYFAFASEFKSRQVEFHTSAVNYGNITFGRPWGPMGLPQSTGVFFLAVAVFLWLRNNKTFAVIAFLAVVASGSRTALIIFAVLCCLGFFRKLKNGFTPLNLSVLIVAMCILLASISQFLVFFDPNLLAQRFILSLSNFGEVFFFGQKPQLDLSSGTPSINNDFITSMFGLGVPDQSNLYFGLGEIGILNNILALGVITATFYLWFVWAVLKRISNPNLKAPIRIFLLVAVFGSLHYEFFFKMPANLVLGMVLAAGYCASKKSEFV